MNTVIADLERSMLAVVDTVTIMTQQIEVLKRNMDRLEDENKKLKTNIKMNLIDQAEQKPREQATRCNGVCID